MKERAGVVNMHLKVDMSEADKMVMLYKIADGVVKEEHYGLALARVVNLPPKVLEVAEAVSRTLEAQAAAKKKSSKSFALARRRKLVLGLRETLVQAQDSPMEGKVLLGWLRKVQEEFVRRMEAIDSEEVGDSDEEEGHVGEVEEVEGEGEERAGDGTKERIELE
jgi:DNA mismatch repair protein MSH4